MAAMLRTLNPMLDMDPGCGPVSGPGPAPSGPPSVSCNQVVEADIENYLGAYRGGTSPLYTPSNVDALVAAGMTYDVDPRLIVAIAVAETQAGTNLNPNWGPYNAWNVSSAKPPDTYSSWNQAIDDVTDLADNYLGNGLTNTASFYKLYAGKGYRTGLKNVNAALTSMGGNTGTLTDPCNPFNPRSPNPGVPNQ